MIPKIIHYCWFGGNKLPENVKKCIESWKKYMPDYEIKRWDETNYDINKCDFIKEAYENKKWAFVSDFARVDILYTYGGIYLDTDVKVLRSFNDLLQLDGFCGFEYGKKDELVYVNSGLAMGMKKGLEIGKILVDKYKNIKFTDNLNNLKKITCPIIQTNILLKYGLIQNNEKQVIENMTIFPTEYFGPMNQYTGELTISDSTYSIHLYSATWFEPVDQERRKLRLKYANYGNFLSNVISTFISYKREYGMLKMWKKILEKIL